MEKPLSMLVTETKANLIRMCNESNLHISILQLIVNELHEEIDKAAQRCIKDERVEYQRMLSQEPEEVKE